jgi:hypothetical protein
MADQQATSEELGDPLAECYAFKGTLFTEFVVKRRVQLYRDRIVTSHVPPKEPSPKQWLLDRSCKLEPDYADEVVRHRKAIRPPKTWTVTATVRGGNQPIELVSFVLRQPATAPPATDTTATTGAVTAAWNKFMLK